MWLKTHPIPVTLGRISSHKYAYRTKGDLESYVTQQEITKHKHHMFILDSTILPCHSAKTKPPRHEKSKVYEFWMSGEFDVCSILFQRILTSSKPWSTPSELQLYDIVEPYKDLRRGIVCVMNSRNSYLKIEGLKSLSHIFTSLPEKKDEVMQLFYFLIHLSSTETKNKVLRCIHSILVEAISNGCATAIATNTDLITLVSDFVENKRGFSTIYRLKKKLITTIQDRQIKRIL